MDIPLGRGPLGPTGLLVLGLLLLVVVLAARSGWRSGASRPVLALAGLVLGFTSGLEVAARVGARWPQDGWGGVALPVGVVVVLTVVGGGLGGAVGGALSRVLAAAHLRVLDRVAGAVVRGGLAVGVCLLALALLPGGPGGPVPPGVRSAVQAVTGPADGVRAVADHLAGVLGRP